MPKRIAILDDDPDFSDMLHRVLEQSGYAAMSYGSVGKLLDAVLKKAPDLLVIDVNLPGVDGREIVRVLRTGEATRRMPVIVVSGTKVAPPEVVQGFEGGADEYLVKPVDIEFFLVRVASLLRRVGEASGPAPTQTLELGNLRMDLAERVIHVDGQRVRLMRLEFDLLQYFLAHPGRVVTRGLLLQEVWNAPMETTIRTVDRFVNLLRSKLNNFVGGRIETLVNVGYMFSVDSAIVDSNIPMKKQGKSSKNR